MVQSCLLSCAWSEGSREMTMSIRAPTATPSRDGRFSATNTWDLLCTQTDWRMVSPTQLRPPVLSNEPPRRRLHVGRLGRLGGLQGSQSRSSARSSIPGDDATRQGGRDPHRRRTDAVAKSNAEKILKTWIQSVCTLPLRKTGPKVFWCTVYH